MSVDNPCQFCHGSGKKYIGSEDQFTAPCDICKGTGIEVVVRLVNCYQCNGTGELQVL